MRYLALYRKFRPSTFEEVRGQDHIVKTLKNQIRTGRMAHAYLFCGTRGTGKTTIAKIFAKAVNCENPVDGSPCNECETCKKITSGASMSVVEIDAASNNGVDNIRDIIEDVAYRPTDGKYRVYIIDEVHMLSPGAFNALLKTLEEPPEYVIFILATTEAGKIPVTILSRCQRYDFKRISFDVISAHLRSLIEKENIEADDSALAYVARCSDGSMRDAISLLDQCIAFNMGEKLTYDKVLSVLGTVDVNVYGSMLEYIAAGDTANTVSMFEDIISGGRESRQFLNDFIWFLRNLILVTSSNGNNELVEIPSEQMEVYDKLAKEVGVDTIISYIRTLSELVNQIRAASNPKILTEIALIKMTRPAMANSNEAVLERVRMAEQREAELMSRIEQLESMIASGSFVQKNSAPASKTSHVAEEVPEEIPEYVPVQPPVPLKNICDDWKNVVSSFKSGMKRTYLRDAVAKFNTKEDDKTLYLEFKMSMAADMLNNDEFKNELRNIIKRKYNNDVNIAIVTAGERQNVSLQAVNVYNIMSKKINMHIEEE